MRPPKFKRLRVLRRRQIPLKENRGIHIFLLPNLFTTGNMFCGFFSILNAMKGDFVQAAHLIMAATIFDALDGRVARLTKGTSQFGMEYDSLSDLISFGVAPAFLMYLWAVEPFGRIGAIGCFIYMACTALRLARFNVQSSVIEKKYFQGVPSPMAAGVVASSVLAFTDQNWDAKHHPAILAMAFILGLSMVSTVRYRSFKELDIRKRSSFATLIGVLVVFGFIVVDYEVNLFLVLAAYVVIGAIAAIFRPRPKVANVLVAESPEEIAPSKTNPQPEV